MISIKKCEEGYDFEIEGINIEILAEFSVLVSNLVKNLRNFLPEEKSIEVVKQSFLLGIENYYKDRKEN